MRGLRRRLATRPSGGGPRAGALLPVLLAGTLLLLCLPSAAVAGGLTVAGPVGVNGAFLGDVDGGALRVHTTREVTTIRADGLALDLRWRSGIAGGPPGNEDYAKYGADAGSDREAFEDVEVRIAPYRGPLELLLEHGTNGRVTGVGHVSLPSELPPYVVRVGQSPQTRSASGDAPFGFWYAPDPTWTMAQGIDQAHLAGNGSLFVNNATVTITRGDEVLWQNWTGSTQRQESPLTHRYEERLLRMDLTGATLDLAVPDGITVLGPALTLDVTGVVSAAGVEGVLEQEAQRILFDGGSMELQGEGEVTVHRAPDRETGLTLQVPDPADFRVEGGRATPVDPGPPLGTSWPWLGLGALAVIAGAAAVIWRSPELRERWRTRRYEYWSRLGHDLADERRFAKAATAFERATRAAPDRAMGWYQLALARLEAGEYEGTLALVGDARDHGVDELDLLEVQVEAALRAGRIDQCRQALTALADGSLAMAVSLARDLELGPDVMGPELSDRLGKGDPPGGLPGYV